jgi:hypothetical protein
MKSFKEFRQELAIVKLPFLDDVIVTEDLVSAQLIREGKEYNGRFEGSLRVDNPTHGVGMRHAHVLGRKGEELGVVNYDGTPSHGSKFRVHDADADKLRTLGFTIPPDGVVEWILLDDQPTLLLD